MVISAGLLESNHLEIASFLALGNKFSLSHPTNLENSHFADVGNLASSSTDFAHDAVTSLLNAFTESEP